MEVDTAYPTLNYVLNMPTDTIPNAQGGRRIRELSAEVLERAAQFVKTVNALKTQRLACLHIYSTKCCVF